MNKFIELFVGGRPYFINVSHIVLIKKSENNAVVYFTPLNPDRWSCMTVDESYDEVLKLITE
ncbi:MAG: hypothetical protein H6Q13_3336 [Bacteroidetes bacterium]|nr:hypothetical protein [Bacteroidota bacterium]